MCFELLGFDIMLDQNLKPMLLEVNSAPSFGTDSPLDYDIKRRLFVDMFGILGLTIERKQEKLLSVYQQKLERLTSRVNMKQKQEQKSIKLMEV